MLPVQRVGIQVNMKWTVAAFAKASCTLLSSLHLSTPHHPPLTSNPQGKHANARDQHPWLAIAYQSPWEGGRPGRYVLSSCFLRRRLFRRGVRHHVRRWLSYGRRRRRSKPGKFRLWRLMHLAVETFGLARAADVKAFVPMSNLRA